MLIEVDKELGLCERVRKEFVNIGLEKDIAEEFKRVAKKNGITYSMLLRYLIDKAKKHSGKKDG